LERESFGWRVENMAFELGRPLMWWQRIVADVALEVDSETGRLAFRDVVVSVMRQMGKTHLIFAGYCARCLLWGGTQRVVYTMQDGHNARKKVKEEHLPLLKSSPIWQLVDRPYLSDGNTNILFRNGSRVSVVSNAESSGEGMSEIDMLIFDEAHADSDDRRERALSPTTATRREAQIWTPSTPGDLKSVFFRRKVDEGRVAVNAGKNTGICYFEFAVADDEDPYDKEVLRRRMPAYGVLVHDEYVDAEQRKPEPLYRRNVGGQWVANADGLFPVEWWLAVNVPGLDTNAEPVYAIDALEDRSMAAICKADRDGRIVLVAQHPGTDWVVDAFLENMPNVRVHVAKNGPMSLRGDDMKRAGLTVEWVDDLTVRKACSRFYDGVADPNQQKLQVRRDERFDKAITAAARRKHADLWQWNRDAPGADILTAASLAYNAALDSESTPFAL
jgi:hypothetical protein